MIEYVFAFFAAWATIGTIIFTLYALEEGTKNEEPVLIFALAVLCIIFLWPVTWLLFVQSVRDNKDYQQTSLRYHMRGKQ